MLSYTHYEFGSKRHRPDRICLDPPLKLATEWCKKGVGYLPRALGDKIFLSYVEGFIKAFNSSSQILWTFSLPDAYEPLPPFDGDILISGKNVITRFNNTLFCIDVDSGELKAKYEVPKFGLEAAIIQGSRLISIYVKKDECFCAAYDLEVGELLWSHQVKYLPDYLAGDEEFVVLSDRKGRVICLDGGTGEQLWVVQFKDLVSMFKLESKELRKGEAVGFPIIHDGLVIVPVKKNHITALEIKTGKAVWVRKLEIENPNKTVLYPDGNIHIVDYKNFITVKIETGEIVRTLKMEEEFRAKGILIPTRFAVTDKFYYIADIYKGVLVSVNKNTGEIPWSQDLKTTIPLLKGPTIIGKYLFLVDLNRNLLAFTES